jgi:hypothetical protein
MSDVSESELLVVFVTVVGEGTARNITKWLTIV